MVFARNNMTAALLVLACVAGAHAWGGLFNRFPSEMLANLGYGRGPHRHYGYGQVEPDEVYAAALEGNRIEDALEEGTPPECYDAGCLSNGDCCPGFVCFDQYEGGRCLQEPPFAGRKLGEICNRENQCDGGLVCEKVAPGDMHVCRPPTSARKQYNEECSISSECDASRGLCCIMQRRHRQKARKICGYFKETHVCIGPVASEHEFNHVGEKRVGGFRMH